MIEAEGDEPNQIFDIAIILNCCSVVKRTIELTRNQWDDSSDDMQKHIYNGKQYWFIQIELVIWSAF